MPGCPLTKSPTRPKPHKPHVLLSISRPASRSLEVEGTMLDLAPWQLGNLLNQNHAYSVAHMMYFTSMQEGLFTPPVY